MEDVSRAYAILLHAAGLFKETRRKAITDYVCEVVSKLIVKTIISAVPAVDISGGLP